MVAFHCSRAGVDATDGSVEVTYEWAADPARLTDLKVLIHLPRCADEERRQAILRAARYCPVHETITSLDGVPLDLAD